MSLRLAAGGLRRFPHPFPPRSPLSGVRRLSQLRGEGGCDAKKDAYMILLKRPQPSMRDSRQGVIEAMRFHPLPNNLHRPLHSEKPRFFLAEARQGGDSTSLARSLSPRQERTVLDALLRKPRPEVSQSLAAWQPSKPKQFPTRPAGLCLGKSAAAVGQEWGPSEALPASPFKQQGKGSSGLEVWSFRSSALLCFGRFIAPARQHFMAHPAPGTLRRTSCWHRPSAKIARIDSLSR